MKARGLKHCCVYCWYLSLFLIAFITTKLCTENCLRELLCITEHARSTMFSCSEILTSSSHLYFRACWHSRIILQSAGRQIEAASSHLRSVGRQPPGQQRRVVAGQEPGGHLRPPVAHHRRELRHRSRASPGPRAHQPVEGRHLRVRLGQPERQELLSVHLQRELSRLHQDEPLRRRQRGLPAAV